MDKVNCVITGSGGYVGSYLVKRLKNYSEWNIYEMGRNKPIAYQLGQSELPNLNGMDILIHCAYDFSFTKFEDIYRVNVLGTLELFKHAKKSGISKIIFISSMSAFSGTKSFYGKAKLIVEEKSKDLDIIIRPGLIFSKNASGIFGSINKFVKLFPIVPLIGWGNQLFYPCYLEDLFQLILFLLKNDSDKILPSPIIAASSYPIKFKEIIKVLAASNKKKVYLLPIPYWLLYSLMKILERFNIKMGLRPDSLIGAQYFDRSVHDFKFLKDNNLEFRQLNKITCS